MKQNKSPFKWRHFEPSLILLCVRWYCCYQLSYPEAFAMSQAEKVLPFDCRLRRVKYLNNIIEQDHHAIRRR